MRIRSNKGFTLIELLIVVAIIGIIAAIAVPGLLRARMAGNEASAIGSLRAINSSQQAYASSCVSGHYAKGLVTLGVTPAGGGAPFISPDLSVPAADASVQKSGYDITMGAGDDSKDADANTVICQGAAVNATDLGSSYYVWADPTTPNSTGVRYFWTNTLGTIYVDPLAPIHDKFGSLKAGSGAPLQ